MTAFITEMLYCEDCNVWFPVSYQGFDKYLAFEIEDQAHIDGDHDLSGGIEH